MRRILIVDDEPELRFLIEAALQDKFDCEVTQASGGNEAYQLISIQPFDIVITDLSMPNGSGLDLLGALRRADVQIPTILFTGSITEMLAPYFGSPLVAVISKPELGSLLSCIHERLKAIA